MTTENPYSSCKKRIYEFNAPHNLYSMAWSNATAMSDFFRLAVGSYIEKYENMVHVIQLDPETDGFVQTACIQHAYPTTQVQWSPKSVKREGKDILATTGDYLRLWEVPTTSKPVEDSTVITRPQHLYDSNKTKNSCTPLTNMDWNSQAENIICVCCIDPICTIWDIEKGKIQSKILAHDHSSAVFDVKFKPEQASIFATAGADGSMRLFDLRNLQHSAIVFESKKPLLRLDWNNIRSSYIAVLDYEGQCVKVIDIRNPSSPLCSLTRHRHPVNAIQWAPHSETHIATAGEDMNVFIWNLESSRFTVSGDPLLEYCAKGCINNMQWSHSQMDWVSIAYDDSLQILVV